MKVKQKEEGADNHNRQEKIQGKGSKIKQKITN